VCASWAVVPFLGGITFNCHHLKLRRPGLKDDATAMSAGDAGNQFPCGSRHTGASRRCCCSVFDIIAAHRILTTRLGKAMRWLYHTPFLVLFHPAVYIMVLPAFGWHEILRFMPASPCSATPRWCTPFLGLFFLGLIVWAITCSPAVRPPWMRLFFTIVHGFIVGTNRAIKFFKLARHTLGGQNRTGTAPCFSAVPQSVHFVFGGGITGVALAPGPLRYSCHDTTSLSGISLHRLWRTVSSSCLDAILSLVFPKFQRRMLNEHLGRLHLGAHLHWFQLCFAAPALAWHTQMVHAPRVAEYDPQVYHGEPRSAVWEPCLDGDQHPSI